MNVGHVIAWVIGRVIEWVWFHVVVGFWDRATFFWVFRREERKGEKEGEVGVYMPDLIVPYFVALDDINHALRRLFG